MGIHRFRFFQERGLIYCSLLSFVLAIGLAIALERYWFLGFAKAHLIKRRPLPIEASY